MKRYKTTSIRDKRSIVRALNTFSKQYEYIFCDDMTVDLNCEPINYYYKDNTSEYFKNNVVYSKIEAKIDIKNTELILETIDNLISLNRKKDIKEKLKETVLERDNNGSNSFLIHQDISLNQIEYIVDNKKFAKRILSQIKNRVMFRRTGVYSLNNENSSIKSRILFTIPTNQIEILIKELAYIIDMLHLFEEDTINITEIKNEYEELKNLIDQDKNNSGFDLADIPNENNTSLYHPIDEQYYNESGNESQLTIQQVYQNRNGMYKEELYSNYENISDEYEEKLELICDYEYDVSSVLYLINDIMKYYVLEDRTFNQVGSINDELYEKYETFFEQLDEHKKEFESLLFKYGYFEHILDEKIKSKQNDIMSFIDECAKYPISDFKKFYEELDKETKKDFCGEFDLTEKAFDYIVKFESAHWWKLTF